VASLLREKNAPPRNPTAPEKGFSLAAIRRFSKFGYRRTSINDVAEEAGLARAPTVLPLLEEKAGTCLFAGLERFNAHLLEPCGKPLARRMGSAAERIRATVMAQVRHDPPNIVHGHGQRTGAFFKANLELRGAVVVEECLRHGEETSDPAPRTGHSRRPNSSRSDRAPASAEIAHIIVQLWRRTRSSIGVIPPSRIGRICAKQLNFILDSIRASGDGTR